MNRTRSFYWIILIMALSVLALLPATPALYPMPDTDSSIFLYMGQKIREGQLPFRDLYDHKPPLIFYVNALGLALGGGSRWGVWALELLAVSASGLAGFAFLRRYFGNFIAGAAASVMILNLVFVHERGNLTEEYALPFMFAAVLLLGSADRAGRPGWRLFGIGCALALASSLKQPMLGIGVSIAAYLAVSRLLHGDWRGLLRDAAQIGLGFITVWIGWFVYFTLVGIFPEFWEAAFQYNFALSGIAPHKRVQSLFNAVFELGRMSEVFLVAIAAWLALVHYLLTRDARLPRFLASRWTAGGLAVFGLLLALKGGLSIFQPVTVFDSLWLKLGFLMTGVLLAGAGLLVWQGAARQLVERVVRETAGVPSPLFLPLMIALVDFPVAMGLSSLSGNNFKHYFMALLPSVTILIAFALYVVRLGIQSSPGRVVPAVFTSVVVLLVMLPGAAKTIQVMPPRTDRQVEEAIAYVAEHTAPGDTVLQWGTAPAINLFTGRESPTRFFFADPLFVAGYSGRAQTGLLLSELQARPPALLIDAKMVRLPLITAPDGADCGIVRDPRYYQQVLRARADDPALIPEMPEGMGDVYYWICQNYSFETSVGELGWDFYRWRGN